MSLSDNLLEIMLHIWSLEPTFVIMNKKQYTMSGTAFKFIVSSFVLLLFITACAQSGDGDSKVLDSSDVMPRFPGCEDQNLPDDDAKYMCSLQTLMDYLGQELKYPAEAKSKGTEGEAVVQFIIQADGSVTFEGILEDPGDGLGEEAARQVKRMIKEGIKWRPGYQKNKPVAVRFNLPVDFKLPRDPNTGMIKQ